jgi:SanA protein
VSTSVHLLSRLFKKHKAAILISIAISALVIIVLMAACYFIIAPYKKFVITTEGVEHINVGLVLGAGVAKNGRPYDELKARLDSASDALSKNKVDKLVLSGDNRYKNYDEPTAMFNYLTKSKHIPASKLQRDYAGRSTYASCERAAKVFKLKKVIIFSAGSHLPRAIYLCRHFGVEAYGISSGVEANNSARRELLARVKALYNTELIGEPTVLGDPIPIN